MKAKIKLKTILKHYAQTSQIEPQSLGGSTNQILPAAVKLSPPFPPDGTCLYLQIHVSFSEPLQRRVVLTHPPAIRRIQEIDILILIYNKNSKFEGALFLEGKNSRIFLKT